MTDKEAMKLALEALETLMIEHGSIYEKAIAALKEALAQPEQEPVAWEQFYTPAPQRTEQNFCPRCGKRTNDIHTCTPPKENT
jgi:hypothetical protein